VRNVWEGRERKKHTQTRRSHHLVLKNKKGTSVNKLTLVFFLFNVMALIIIFYKMKTPPITKIPSGKKSKEFLVSPLPSLCSNGGWCEVGSFKSPELFQSEGELAVYFIPERKKRQLNGI
jgi:hypothetical protein